MLNPKIWGPNAWYTIHTLAYTFDPVNLGHYRNLLSYFRFVFPCKRCKKHYTKYIKKHPFTQITTRPTIIRWTHEIHNSLNIHLKKKRPTVAKVNHLYSGKINDRRIINFLRVIVNDARGTKDPQIQLAIREILKLVPKVFPCKRCRETLKTIKFRNWAHFFQVQRKISH